MTPLELGLQIIEELREAQLPEAEAQRFKFPKCGACRRRPELVAQKGRWLVYLTGLREEPRVLNVPRLEIFPCCSARLVKEAPISKKVQRRMVENFKQRKGTDGPA